MKTQLSSYMKFKRRTVCAFFMVLFLTSCASSISDARIDTYDIFAEKVKRAESSEELLNISYNLKNTLDSLDSVLVATVELQQRAVAGDEESLELLDSINSAKKRFNESLLQKEMDFYIKKTEKRRR